MISRSELKMSAKESLRGRWGISIALMLIIFALPIVLNFIPLLGALIILIITPALTYLPQQAFLKVKRNENVEIGKIFSGILSNLGTYWGIAAITFLKLLPWVAIMFAGSILSIYTMAAASPVVSDPLSPTLVTLLSASSAILSIGGYILTFTKSFYYVMAIYVKTDNPNMSCAEAVMQSKELMTGHRFEYFVLALSFIGWALIGGITLGLGMFYVLPYMYTTFAAFYDNINHTAEYTQSDNNEFIQY